MSDVPDSVEALYGPDSSDPDGEDYVSDVPDQVGDHVQDGGEWGTIVRCEECGGSGVLHQPDVMPEPVEPEPVPDQVEALAKVLIAASEEWQHNQSQPWQSQAPAMVIATAALAWVREQLNDESLRDEVAAAAKGWHPLRASDTPVVNAVLAAVRAHFGDSE